MIKVNVAWISFNMKIYTHSLNVKLIVNNIDVNKQTM